jgi:hypothetical protein
MVKNAQHAVAADDQHAVDSDPRDGWLGSGVFACPQMPEDKLSLWTSGLIRRNAMVTSVQGFSSGPPGATLTPKTR